jgi:MFS family permease
VIFFPERLKNKIYTSQFWLLCTSSLLFFTSFNMIIPVLSGYLESLGGGEYKGFIISLFTITALFSRPFSGKLADIIGRIPVIMFGAVVCIICSILYPILASVSGLLALRLVHGFSTGFTPTGQTAYLADIIPPERRGEGMGILGTASMLGMAGGFALGGNLETYAGINSVFYSSAIFALFSILILAGLKETLPDKKTPHVRYLKVKVADLFEPRVLAPCIVMVLSAYAFGSVITMIPDYSPAMGIENKGLLMTYFTVASLMVRLIAGKASDRWGRKPVLWVSVTAIVAGMFMVAMAKTKFEAITGFVLYGLAQGTTSPTLLAWATDLSDPERKGRGVSSLYIFMELGIGLGAFFSGWIYSNERANLVTTFIVSGGLALLGVLYLLVERSSRKYKP